MAVILERNLGLEFVRITEGAALASARWMGRGEKNNADKAAVDAMRARLDSLDIDGTIVIGEGEKDKAPMLYNGERVGTRSRETHAADGTAMPELDIAVDPIDGTRLLSNGLPNALSVIAIAEKGSMFYPGPVVYMDKLAVGPEARDVIDLEAPPATNLRAIARAKGKEVRDLTVAVLDRPRHADLIAHIRAVGARLKLISDGDVAAAIAAALPEAGIDALMGIGGSPEAVITAAALKCLGGAMQARLWPRDDAERKQALDFGLELGRVLGTSDLVRGEDVSFAATGITDGEMLEGVHFFAEYATTESLAMRSRSGTLRRIAARHRSEKLRRLAAAGVRI